MSKKQEVEQGSTVPEVVVNGTTVVDAPAPVQDTSEVLLKELSSRVRELAARIVDVETNTIPAVGQNNPPLPDLPPSIVAALKKPLPSAAISTKPGGAGLSSIKPIYIVERLNEVFGVNGWYLDEEYVREAPGKNNPHIVVHCTLTVPKYGIVRHSWGGNENNDLGDSYKGAVSDAMSRMASSIYIGIDVYKGFKDAPSKAEEAKEAAAKKAAQAANAPAAGPQPVPVPAPTAKPVAQATTASGKGCDDCSKKVEPFILKGADGQEVTYSVEQLLDNSQGKYKLNLCAGCQQKRAQARIAASGNRVQ